MSTRKTKAAELLRFALKGPDGMLGFPHSPRSGTSWGTADAEATRQYRSYVDTWVLPLIVELVPELRGTDLEALIAARNAGPKV